MSAIKRASSRWESFMTGKQWQQSTPQLRPGSGKTGLRRLVGNARSFSQGTHIRAREIFCLEQRAIIRIKRRERFFERAVHTRVLGAEFIRRSHIAGVLPSSNEELPETFSPPAAIA